jgi:CSLREA domain-containing protein
MSKYIHLVFIVLAALGLVTLFFLILPAREAPLASAQAVISVDTLQDEDNSDGDCSLREAIRAATENSAVDGCPAGNSSADTIVFSVSGTILLTEKLILESGGALVIDGANRITISGGGSEQLFVIYAGSDFELLRLTLVDGYSESAGGGIYNDGLLTISRSTIAGNRAGFGAGIANWGTLILTNSTLTGNITEGGVGGGISNYAMLTVINSTISGNHAETGGGIYNSGQMTISNTTLANNTASQSGGGIYQHYGSMEVTYSTLTGNGAELEGGGLYFAPELTEAVLSSSIVAYSPSGGNCGSITIPDAGHNLEDTDTCHFLESNDSISNTDPQLGPLQDNGGPTLTRALLEGSPAIDHANPADCPSTDQRDFPRPADGDEDGVAVCDIGSYELVKIVKLYLPMTMK